MIKENSKTSYGKSSGKYDTTADFLTNIENRNGKFYTDKATIDKIGQVEARGEDFSPLNKRIMSSRASTEGGTSVVYKYSDELGTKYLIHEVTDARGYIIHRDFDAVRISSGQVVTFIPDAGGSIVINGKCFFIKISLISGISDTKIGLKSGNLFTDFLQYTGNFKRCISV